MNRDAIYCRYSSNNQDRGVSIELQLEACRRVAGLDPLEFIDRAVTGRTMHRDSFRQMMDAAEQGKFNRLIVYKWDRFGRNAETHATIADLEDMGIKVTSATEGDDFLARGVGLLVSEDYSRKLSERVRESMRIRFRNQHCFMGGTVPYGYSTAQTPDGLSRLVINEEEAKLVRRVFHLHLHESIGTKKMADRFNTEGLRTRLGHKWVWNSIDKMLKRKTYIGDVEYGRRKESIDRRTGRTKITRLTEFLTYHDESLRIIDQETWDAVQEIMAKRAACHDYRAVKQTRTFSNRVVCGVCGSVMYTRHTTRQQYPIYHYLVCGRRDRIGPEVCSNTSRPREDAMLALVQDGIRQVLKQRDAIISRAVELAEVELDQSEGERQRLEKELAKVEAGLSRFTRMLRDPSFSDVEIRGLLSQIGVLEKERDSLNQSLRDLAAKAGVDRHAVIREVRVAIEEAERSILEVTTPAVLNKAIERFVGRIIVEPDGSVHSESTSITAEALAASTQPRTKARFAIRKAGASPCSAAAWMCSTRPRTPSSSRTSPSAAR